MTLITGTPSVSDQHDVTLGEVYRRLGDIDERHGGSLERIDSHLGALNSKVATHERMHAEGNIRIANVEREIFGAKRDREERISTAAAAATKDGIVITVPMDVKTLTALVLTVAALIMAWLKTAGR
jgi:hypothetical protein